MDMDGKEKEKWNTQKMQEHRNEWSLAADIQLLCYVQQFSQKLLGETHSTLKALNELEGKVAKTSVDVSNLGSKLWALSDTQFVENRVYDDDDDIVPTHDPTPQKGLDEGVSETIVINKLKEALQNGFQVLDTKFEMIQVPDSDSDDDSRSPNTGIVMKPLNRYKERRLPHLIGSSDFCADDTVGLRETPSDEEFMSSSDKAYDESDHSDSDNEPSKPAHLLTLDKGSSAQPHLPSSAKVKNKATPISGIIDAEEFTDIFYEASLINRPPSASSSVTSAQSMNTPEPIKKINEDFGKSGTGRLPVFVAGNRSDSTPVLDQQSQIKRPALAGGVKILQDDFIPGLGETEQTIKNKWEEKNNDNTKTHSNTITSNTKNSVPSKATSTVPKYEDSLFDDDDDDRADDLFSDPLKSNISASAANKIPQPKIPSKVNPSVASEYTSSKKFLFGSPGNQSPDEDDLFSDKGLFSNTKDEGLFSGDSFSYDTGDIFSDLDGITSNTDKPPTGFKGLGNSNSNKSLPPSNVVHSKTSVESKGSKIPFIDKNDLFGDQDFSDDNNLFGTSPVYKQISKQSSSQTKNNLFASKNPKTSISMNEDDDLFKNISPSSKGVFDDDLLFSSVSKQDETRGAPNTRNTEGTKEQIKKTHYSSKLKKGPEIKSIFDSDSDDDLFSSPQGSLSSKKSIHVTSTVVGPENKQKTFDNNKEEVLFAKSTNVFSSIFSDDLVVKLNPTAGLESTSDSFKDDEDLFGSTLVKNKSAEIGTTSVKYKDYFKGIDSRTKEAINEECINNLPVQTVIDPVLENKSIFQDNVSADIQKAVTSKPPNTLDIRPISDLLSANTSLLLEEKGLLGDSNKSATPKSPLKNLSSIFPDTPDGDATKPTSARRDLPGKLKASQLININTAALLPGSTPELRSETTQDIEDRGNQICVKDNKSSLIKKSSYLHSEDPLKSLEKQEHSIPSTRLLQSVVKERAKIPVKRRPPSRHARQTVIKAFTSESTVIPSPDSSNLMSPSTDEDDLFGVPSLGLFTSDDVKVISPTANIFGTPTVLSPEVKDVSPSTYPSPFVSSQPPPLDDDDDDDDYDDIFGHQDDLFVSPVKESKPTSNASKKSTFINKDKLFDDTDEDSLFSDIREGPPPLIIGEDDEDYDELTGEICITNSSVFDHVSRRGNSSTLTSQTNFQRINNERVLEATAPPTTQHPLNNFAHSNTLGNTTLESIPKLSPTSENPSTDRKLIKSSLTEDNTLSRTENSILPELLGTGFKSQAKGSFAKGNSTKEEESSSFNDLFTDEDLFSPAAARFESISNINSTQSIKTVHKVEKQDLSTLNTSKNISLKNKSLFNDDDDDIHSYSNIPFLSGASKLAKSAPHPRQSLFGDVDEDDSIFGSSVLINKSHGSSKGSTVQGLSSKTKQQIPENSAKGPKSRKPVKLESKETSYDPLLGNQD